MKKLMTKLVVTIVMTLAALGLDKVAIEVFNANVDRHTVEFGGRDGYMEAHPVLGVIFLIIFPIMIFVVLPGVLLGKLINKVLGLIDKKMDKHIDMTKDDEDDEWLD